MKEFLKSGKALVSDLALIDEFLYTKILKSQPSSPDLSMES